jgi:branched-chain amino acid transport system substrate-binding protein
LVKLSVTTARIDPTEERVMTERQRYRFPVAVGVLALTIAVAACGSSSNKSSSGTATSAAQSSSSSTDLGNAAGIYSKFTGGSVGKADSSKAPVVVGFVNDEGGIPSFPEGSVAAQAAAKFVNDNLGGVDGHPLQLVVCKVAGSEEQGQGCAQKFLGDKRIKVITEDSQVVGAQSFHQTLAGKLPVVIGSPNSVADATAKNAYGISAGVFGTDPGFVSYATQFAHAKSASLLFPADDPTGQAAAKQIKGDLGKAGIKVTDVGYKSSSPDIFPSVIASKAGKTDVTVTLFPSPPTCIAGGKALQRANISKPVLALNLCIAAPVKQALGDYPKWTYVSLNTNPEVPGDAATDAYVQVMKAYAGDNSNIGGFAPHAFMAVLAATKALNAAGGADATSAAIADKLKAYTGPTPMFAPDVKYGSIPPLPSIPSLQTRLYTYNGGGKWTDVTNGKWVLPGA